MNTFLIWGFALVTICGAYDYISYCQNYKSDKLVYVKDPLDCRNELLCNVRKQFIIRPCDDGTAFHNGECVANGHNCNLDTGVIEGGAAPEFSYAGFCAKTTGDKFYSDPTSSKNRLRCRDGKLFYMAGCRIGERVVDGQCTHCKDDNAWECFKNFFIPNDMDENDNLP